MSDQDKQRSRPPAEKKKAEEVAAPEQAARELVSVAADAVEEGHKSMARSAGPLTAGPDANNKEADITDEAKSAGPVFGDFLKSVGFAVAETQDKLDKTFRDTAHALSEELIDVIAVFEQQIDDDGRMLEGHAHVQKLPLINYVMPTIQEISHCSISADMQVREFSSSDGFQIQGQSHTLNAGASGSFGPLGGSVSAHADYGMNIYDTKGGSNRAEDTAAGTMHLEATIQPRETVQLPKPFVTQKGPALKLTLDKVDALKEEVAGATEGAPKTQRRKGTKATITAELRGSNGAELSGKKLEVSVNQPTVGQSIPSSTTDSKGLVTIELERESADEWKPLETTVRVWLGLVSQSIIVAL